MRKYLVDTLSDTHPAFFQHPVNNIRCRTDSHYYKCEKEQVVPRDRANNQHHDDQFRKQHDQWCNDPLHIRGRVVKDVPDQQRRLDLIEIEVTDFKIFFKLLIGDYNRNIRSNASLQPVNKHTECGFENKICQQRSDQEHQELIGMRESHELVKRAHVFV